jgi:hypothetical protein
MQARVEQQRNHENGPSEDCLVVGADERRQMADRAKISLDATALAFHRGLLDLQVGKGLRLDRKPVLRLLRWLPTVRGLEGREGGTHSLWA